MLFVIQNKINGAQIGNLVSFIPYTNQPMLGQLIVSIVSFVILLAASVEVEPHILIAAIGNGILVEDKLVICLPQLLAIVVSLRGCNRVADTKEEGNNQEQNQNEANGRADRILEDCHDCANASGSHKQNKKNSQNHQFLPPRDSVIRTIVTASSTSVRGVFGIFIEAWTKEASCFYSFGVADLGLHPHVALLHDAIDVGWLFADRVMLKSAIGRLRASGTSGAGIHAVCAH